MTASIDETRIPDELKESDRWILWRRERQTKIPCTKNGRPASVTNPANWHPFPRALEYARAEWCSGIGFCLRAPGEPELNAPALVAFDLDHVLATDGTLAPRAAWLLEQLNSYTEITPSGDGLRVWVRARKPPGSRCVIKDFFGPGTQLEIYDSRRFLTVTGAWWASTPGAIEARQDVVERLMAQWATAVAVLPLKASADSAAAGGQGGEGGPSGEGAQGAVGSVVGVVGAVGGVSLGRRLDDLEVISHALQSRTGARFQALYSRGDLTEYSGDESGADLALLNILAFWCAADAEQMERVFTSSALGQRAKWRERPDYRARSIARAIDGCQKVYGTGGAARESAQAAFGGAADDGAGAGDAGGGGDLPAPPLVDQLGKCFERITEEELQSASLTPRVIVPGLLYANFRVRVAPGGVGKTTLAIDEAVSLALGEPLYGRQPPTWGRTVLVTREDAREQLVARLGAIMAARSLGSEQRAAVLDRFKIMDLTATPLRLSRIAGEVIVPNIAALDALAAHLSAFGADWVIFDPLVSFSVGEQRVNDAEQGIVEAARYLLSKIDACVEVIHHSGKQNAREGTLDQYTARGGSALPDGARMIAVIQPVKEKDWLEATGSALMSGESGLVMALPKITYAAPTKPVYIRRMGFAFTPECVAAVDHDARAAERAHQLERFLVSEWAIGRKYSGKQLESRARALSMTRTELREAASELVVSGRVAYHSSRGQTAYYHPRRFSE
jgi:hypothetical protein